MLLICTGWGVVIVGDVVFSSIYSLMLFISFFVYFVVVSFVCYLF